MIQGAFHVHDKFLFLSIPSLSNSQKLVTGSLSSNSDWDCLAIKEASLSGKSESRSSRDSEGMRLAPRGERPEGEESRLELD